MQLLSTQPAIMVEVAGEPGGPADATIRPVRNVVGMAPAGLRAAEAGVVRAVVLGGFPPSGGLTLFGCAS